MDEKEMADGAALIVEDFIKCWLRGTEAGLAMLAHRTMDEAVDAMFELLNAGFVKIVGDEEVLRDIVPLAHPEPPSAPLRRPRRN